MAQIDLDTIKRIDKERNTIHAKVFSTYTVFEHDGEKIFQIDTYGKWNRENPEKISQSIQLDEKAARYLVEISKKGAFYERNTSILQFKSHCLHRGHSGGESKRPSDGLLKAFAERWQDS